MKAWKVIGLAGLAGVAASGVAVARSERRRRAYTPDDVRSRLHARYEEAQAALPAEPVEAPSGRGSPHQRGCRPSLRRRRSG